MINVSPEVVTIMMLGGVLLGVLTGFPVALMVGSVALITGYLLLGPSAIEIIYNRFWSLILNYTLLAVPLFTFMGIILEKSGISEGLYDAIYVWFGKIRGGLALTTVLFGTILAACVEIGRAHV